MYCEPVDLAPLGIVGGGPIGRMLLQAAAPLGLHPRVLAPTPEHPAARVSRNVVVGDAGPEVLDAFTGSVAVATFEHDGLDPDLLADLERRGRTLRPGAAALRSSIDKAAQRRSLAAARFPVPPAITAADAEQVADAVRVFGLPAVIRPARAVPGGAGVRLVTARDQLAAALASMPGAVLVEPLLGVEAVLSVLVARRPSGEVRPYPVIRIARAEGGARVAEAPSGLPADVERRAQQLAVRVADHLDAVGVLAVELLLVGGELVVHDLVARPHESGHLTVEACATSQLENHLRAVLDWPLGPTDLLVPAAAAVAVTAADETAVPHLGVHTVLAGGDVNLHLYDVPPAPGVELGHVTVTGTEPDAVRGLAAWAAGSLGAARDLAVVG